MLTITQEWKVGQIVCSKKTDKILNFLVSELPDEKFEKFEKHLNIQD